MKKKLFLLPSALMFALAMNAQITPENTDLALSGRVPSSPAITGEGSDMLPLQSFIGDRQGENNSLTWTIAGKTTVNSFVVEKSIDATHFTPISTIAANNANGIQQYQFTDNDVMDGTASYYRLKTTGKDGAPVYSAMVAITSLRNNPSAYSISQNTAANDVITLETVNTAGQNIQVNILDATGKIYWKKQINNSDWKDGTTSISTGTISAGIYFLQVQNDKKEVLSLLKFRKK